MRRLTAPSIALAATGALLAASAAASAAPPTVIRTGGPSAPKDPKVAVVAGSSDLSGDRFKVVDKHGHTVLRGHLKTAKGSPLPWKHAATADLTRVKKSGSYRVKAAGKTSRAWVVSSSAESTLVKRLLRIFAANSDGNEPNPVFGPAHLNDAIVKGGALDGQHLDLTGGWRDAGDQLKITITTASTVSFLSLAARMDSKDAARLHKASDVGVRWLLKAHPQPGVFIGLVGDDRDHSTGFRDPADDDANTVPGVGIRFAYPTVSSNVLGATAAGLALRAASSSGATRDQLIAAAREWYAQAKADKRAAVVQRPEHRQRLLPGQHLHRRPCVRRDRAVPHDRRAAVPHRGERLLPRRRR